MMGTKERAFVPLARVSLEELVPSDSFYRHLDSSLDLSFVRSLVAEHYAAGGRPSIDPVVFFKLQLVMFFEGIRSERQLIRVVADRLSLRWYLGYDLTEPLLDHSSLTKIRERYGLDVFRRFFDVIVERCIEAKLVWGRELFTDSTNVEANASLDSTKPRFAIEAHLKELFQGDAEPTESNCVEPEPLQAPIPDNVIEELAETNSRRHDWIAEDGRQDRETTVGSYKRISDYKASSTDPDASLMHLASSSHFGYHTHYVIDGGKARIILTTLVTPAEVTDNQPMLDILWHTLFRWHIRPHHITGDTKYGTIENIKAIESSGIRAYMPLPDNDKRTPFFSKHDFIYDLERDLYICPQGSILPFSSVSARDHLKVYYANRDTCNACPIKDKCTTTNQGRRVSRHVDEEYLDLVRTYHGTGPYEKALRKRHVWVEPLFAEAKEWHGMSRFGLRGLEKVNIEALVIATGQNLKRLLSRLSWGRRPWPDGSMGLRIGVLQLSAANL